MATILFIKSRYLKNLCIKWYFLASLQGEICSALLRGETYVNPKKCHPGVSFTLAMCSMLLRIKILVNDAFSLLLENQSPEECQNGQHGMHVGSLVEFQI